MLSLTFAEFMDGSYDSKYDVGVYVVKNDVAVLYVGISKSNIWNRWFGVGSWRCHMAQYHDGRWVGNSPIGKYIVSNMPESFAWPIELWRVEDCVSFFGDKIQSLGFRHDRIDIGSAEALLMRHYNPLLNVQGNYVTVT